jgi:hypothetical protein
MFRLHPKGQTCPLSNILSSSHTNQFGRNHPIPPHHRFLFVLIASGDAAFAPLCGVGLPVALRLPLRSLMPVSDGPSVERPEVSKRLTTVGPGVVNSFAAGRLASSRNSAVSSAASDSGSPRALFSALHDSLILSGSLTFRTCFFVLELFFC